MVTSASGQKRTDSRPFEDSLQRKASISPFITAQLQYAQFSDRMAFYGGAGAGILVNNRWQLEAEYSTIINQYIQKIIFPESYRFKYWHAGLAFKYHVVRIKAMYGYLGARAAYGRGIWRSMEDTDESYSDNIYILTPELGIGFNAFSFLSTEFGIGYNTAFDVELIGLKEKAFDGIMLSLKMKILKNNR